jgi:hypothetical protein
MMPRAKKGWSARFSLPDGNDGTIRGIKHLSYENFLTPTLGAMQFSPSGGLITAGIVMPTADAIRSRVERFTSVTLPDHVPETVWQMFEVAKGAMVYGLFFYPLYTLGEEHLSKLFEWMVKERYAALSRRKGSSLKAMVQWLLKNERFPDRSEVRWLATYEIRNLASHPTIQTIATPAEASRALRKTRDLIVHFYPTAAN